MLGCNAYNSYEVHVQNCMSTGIFQISVQIYLFIRVWVTQDQCKHLHVCPVLFMFTDNLKLAGAIQVAHEVHPDSAFHQKTPQVFAKLPSSSAQPSGKSQILDPGPTWGRTNNSTPALESTTSIGNPQMNSPRMVRDFHYAFFPEKLQEILNSFCC